MKAKNVLVAVLLCMLFSAPTIFCAQVVPAEAFSEAMESSSEARGAIAANAQDSSFYSDGTRAINEGRWSDAVALFTKVVSERGEHADGAFYWKAYAENKQGQSNVALNTCLELRRGHPKSSWIEECGALEIEIRAKNGQPIQPLAEQDDDLKLLALNSLMKQDERRALSEIQEILASDLAQKVKERALFILAQGQTKQAQELLDRIAQEHSNSSLQATAAEMLAKRHDKQAASASLAGSNADHTITLDVVVTDKSGKPVAGLQPQDFTLLDNKAPGSILSFREATNVTAKTSDPVTVFLVVDGINASFRSVTNTRVEVTKYLRQNEGHLALPTSFIFLSDAGTEIQIEPTRDGNALIADLNQHLTGLRLPRGTELYHRDGKWRHISLVVLDRITASLAKMPGRKLVVWISPGWPSFYRYFWLKNDQPPLFDYIAEVSTALREANITIYSVDPEGVARDQFYYLNFVKGVTTEKKAGFGALMLQVLAYQSGGLVFSGRNDIATLIDRCAADANAYYVLSFHPRPASHRNEYRDLAVQVGKPELQARTRAGYYAQP